MFYKKFEQLLIFLVMICIMPEWQYQVIVPFCTMESVLWLCWPPPSFNYLYLEIQLDTGWRSKTWQPPDLRSGTFLKMPEFVMVIYAVYIQLLNIQVLEVSRTNIPVIRKFSLFSTDMLCHIRYITLRVSAWWITVKMDNITHSPEITELLIYRFLVGRHPLWVTR